MATTIASLANEQQLLETTYRRDGTPVGTLIWPIPWGDGQIAFSVPAQAGKLKRLRNNPRMTLQPGEEPGVPVPGSEAMVGTAEIVDGEIVGQVQEQVIARYGQEAFDASIDMAVEIWEKRYGEYTGEVVVIFTPET